MPQQRVPGTGVTITHTVSGQSISSPNLAYRAEVGTKRHSQPITQGPRGSKMPPVLTRSSNWVKSYSFLNQKNDSHDPRLQKINKDRRRLSAPAHPTKKLTSASQAFFAAPGFCAGSALSCPCEWLFQLDHHMMRRKCDFMLFIFPNLPQQPFDLICEPSERKLILLNFELSDVSLLN